MTVVNQKHLVFALLSVTVVSLACGQQVVTATPTTPADNTQAAVTTPTPTLRAAPSPSATSPAVAVVVAAVVRVRSEPGGERIGFLEVGAELEILGYSDDGEWVHIPEGWVYRGCTDDNPKNLGCEAE